MRKFVTLREDGTVVGSVKSSREVVGENVVEVPVGFDITNKKYENGEWVEFETAPTDLTPTDPEIYQAEMLLMQAEILEKLNAMEV